MRASRREVEEALTGDLRESRTKRSLQRVWELFEKHAADMHGDAQRASRLNVAERPRARQGRAARASVRTLYAGGQRGKEAKGERVPMLATAEEEAGDSATQHVTARRVMKRVDVQRYLERRGRVAAPDSLKSERNCRTVFWP